MHPLPAGDRDGRARATCARWPRSGLLTGRELARVPVDSWLPRTRIGDDVSVGRYVAARMGRAVVDRLVEPLLGGVYAGRADELSLEATLPQLAPHARRERSLLAAARASRAAADAGAQDGAVFGAPRGGVGRLPAAVARLSGADGPHRRHRPRAAPDPGPAGGSSSGRPARPRRCSPTRWCSPSRRRRPPGCCARTRRPRRPS